MTTTTSKGRAGEDKAVAHLKSRGFTIVARNYRTNGGEIDIVAQKDKLLVFVEVKARSSEAHGAAVYAVTPAKQRKIVLAATQFIKEKSPEFDSIRFDVICVLQGVNIMHVFNAFRPKRTTL